MAGIRGDLEAFRAAKQRDRIVAAQRVALQLLCGLDLARLTADATAEEIGSAIRQIDRMIARERTKGLRGHWSYDLDRHIALKQARQSLASAGTATARPKFRPGIGETSDAASKRRREARRR